MVRLSATAKPIIRGGAPLRNANAVKHGQRGVLTLSRAPDSAKNTYRLISTFRRELTAAVTDLHGGVSLAREGMILSACRCEISLKLYEAWARKPERTEEDRLKAAQFAADMSERRDRILERLGLSNRRSGAARGIVAGTDLPELPESLLAEIDAADDDGSGA